MAGELYGDFSRIATIGPGVTGLFAQQGRAVLDSDLNAQSALLTRLLRTMFVDLVGPAGGPSEAFGFEIHAKNEDGGNLAITAGPGRYYVGGMLCELDSTTEYFAQHAFLDPDDVDDQLPAVPFVVYLKVWERSISAIEDPASREVALGANGPDTATRSQVVWQFLTTADVFGQVKDPADLKKPTATAADNGLAAWAAWEKQRIEGRGTLSARASRPEGADDEPCPVPPASAYRGLENQLYRVEVHRVTRDSAGNPTALEFKWSRDNGSATYPIESFGEDGKVVTLTTLGRDRGLMLDVGDYVEVVDDRYVLHPGENVDEDPMDRTTNELLRVMDVEPLDRTVTLSGQSEGVGHVTARHPFLRRWDHQSRPGGPKLGGGGGLVVELLASETSGAPMESTWIDLEDGVQVKFTQGRLWPGDYWLIPARTETGDVEWPGDAASPDALAPMGIDYAFAPLAIVRGENDVVSLRKKFGQLAGKA
jgi:hypothetical protein